MKSKRIQRKRTRGWRMPRGAVYVGRPSKFSNPYAIYFENGKWFIRGVIGVGEQMKGSHSGSPGRRRLSRGRGGLRFHYTQPLLLKVKETNKSKAFRTIGKWRMIMPCRTIRIGDSVGIVCGGSAPRRQSRCKYCNQLALLECDYPLGGGKTCDTPICHACSVSVAPNTDYCRIHNQTTALTGVNPRPVFGQKVGGGDA